MVLGATSSCHSACTLHSILASVKATVTKLASGVPDADPPPVCDWKVPYQRNKQVYSSKIERSDLNARMLGISAEIR
eukprot:6208887-Pleurochrysis_carterae.AAC.2